MKYKDIPKYTRDGNYMVDISFNYLVERIADFIKEDNLELNPDFQRGHVWTKEQQIRYIEYKLANGPGVDVLYFNCVGWMDHFDGPFVCVDGLQRITAIMLFINNEIPAYNTLYKDYDIKLGRKMHAKLNINNLETRKEVLQWYLELNGAGTPHTKEELNRVKLLLEKEV
ncbi:MAG: DUF262 domain-containing protein [Desulfobacteraceae bacterium]|nr:DUF262 domain-containing protein [Desulfobacteraceae bacterium]